MKHPDPSALCALGLALLLGLSPAGAQAPGDLRVALVIGNSAYPGNELLNPANDARAMAETLRAQGFAVTEVRDGTRERMAQALAAVREQLQGRQGIGLLYYAGHGLQMDARNFMVPVDARMRNAADVSAQALDVGAVIQAFRSAGNRMNILVLDACRDNPFGGITTGKGLAPLDAPSGTFLAYATAPGNVAEDGDVKSGNGLYTQYLLQELKRPQARIEDVFKRVRFAVRKASGGRQIPWESTSLEEDFSFNDGRVSPQARATPASLTASFDEEKRLWDQIRNSSNPDEFYAFLQKYPSGTIAIAAQARLNQLQAVALKVQGGDADGQAAPYVREAYRVGDEYTTSSPENNMVSHIRVERAGGDGLAVRREITVNGKSLGKPVAELYDKAGGMVGIEGMFRYNPPQYFLTPEVVQVGKRWQMAYEVVPEPGSPMKPSAVKGEAHVQARETLDLPIGRTDTFRVAFVSYSSAVEGPIRCTFWTSPKLPMLVKTECDTPLPGGKSMRFTETLTSFKRGG